MAQKLLLTLVGLLAAGSTFADPPVLIPLEIPEARVSIFTARTADGCAGGGFESVLENGESTIFEVECPSGQRFSLEVALIENALVITASSGLDLISFYGWLSGVTIPKLAAIMPLVVGIPRELLPGGNFELTVSGEAGGVSVREREIFGLGSRQTVPVLGGDTVEISRLVVSWSDMVPQRRFQFEVFTAAPPSSAIGRKEFDELERRLSAIESLPGIARRLAGVPGVELALLTLPGIWLYRRGFGRRR